MGEIKDLIDKTFGRLKVIKFSHLFKNRCAVWLCECSCGNRKIIRSTCLLYGSTKSCGCLRKEQSRINGRQTHKIGKENHAYKHGLRHTRFYRIWRAMKERCLTERCSNYDKYGGRGIKTCDRWLVFENFRDDMYESYLKHCEKFGEYNTTIDRICNDGNYFLRNCRWATLKEQANNKRNNCLMSYHNKTRTLKQWSEELEIGYKTLFARKKSGWSVEDILTTPVKIR